jgi:prepilin-type N-terminal cleavage/methylation domain-containing protein
VGRMVTQTAPARPIVAMSSAEFRKPTPAVVRAARAAGLWPHLRPSGRPDDEAQGVKSPPDCIKAGGFTLLETLTALAIAAVIILATTGLLHDVLLHFDRGTRRVTEAEHLLQAVHRLAGDFASARFIMRPNVPGASGPAQGVGVLFTGDPSSVTFVAAGGVMAGAQGEEMIKLSVEVDGEVSRLVRRRAAWREPHAHFEDTPPQDPVVLLEGRVDISFTYGRLTPEGALTWSDNWTGEFGLPRLVRVIVREPNSGVDLLAEAPFLVRADAPAACARAGGPPAGNQAVLNAGSGANTNVARRAAQSTGASAQPSGVACLTNGAPGRPRTPDQGRTG